VRSNLFEAALERALKSSRLSGNADCPDFRILAGYHDKSLNPADTKAIERHLSVCAGCRRHMVLMRRLDLGAVEETSSSFLSSRLAALTGAQTRGRSKWLSWPWLIGPTALVSGVALVAILAIVPALPNPISAWFAPESTHPGGASDSLLPEAFPYLGDETSNRLFSAPTAVRTVIAGDRTFTIEIPANWTVSESNLEHFRASGPGGVFLSWWIVPVEAPAQQRREIEGITSTPLDSVQAVPKILPKVDSTVTGLRILRSLPLPANAARGITGAIVRYQFAMRSRTDAEVVSYTASGLTFASSAGRDGSWLFAMQTMAAPTPEFRAKAVSLLRSFSTLRFNLEAVRRARTQSANSEASYHFLEPMLFEQSATLSLLQNPEAEERKTISSALTGSNFD
jgi:hypothetical protein